MRDLLNTLEYKGPLELLTAFLCLILSKRVRRYGYDWLVSHRRAYAKGPTLWAGACISLPLVALPPPSTSTFLCRRTAALQGHAWFLPLSSCPLRESEWGKPACWCSQHYAKPSGLCACWRGW